MTMLHDSTSSVAAEVKWIHHVIPLQTGRLDYSALTRATRVRIPAPEALGFRSLYVLAFFPQKIKIEISVHIEKQREFTVTGFVMNDSLQTNHAMTICTSNLPTTNKLVFRICKAGSLEHAIFYRCTSS